MKLNTASLLRKFKYLTCEDIAALQSQLDRGVADRNTILRRAHDWNAEARSEGRADGRASSAIEAQHY